MIPICNEAAEIMLVINSWDSLIINRVAYNVLIT